MRRLSCRGGLAALALVLVCAGCSKDDVRPDPGPTSGSTGDTTGNTDEPTVPDEPVESSMGVAPTADAALAEQYESTYSLFQIQDLYIGLALPEREGVVVVRYDIRLPNAQLYSSFWAAYSADPNAPDSVSHPMNPELPISVDEVRVEEGRMVGTFRFLVAGTPIRRSRITGQFSIEAFEGASDSDLLAQTNFELTRPE